MDEKDLLFQDIWNGTFQQLAVLPVSANRDYLFKESMEWNRFRTAWNGTVHELEELSVSG